MSLSCILFLSTPLTYHTYYYYSYTGRLCEAGESAAVIRLAPLPVLLARGAGLCGATARGHE